MTDPLADILAALTPRLRDILMSALTTMRRGVDYPALQAALKAGDVEAAIEALNIDRGVFSAYAIERQAGFAEAGAVTAAVLTKARSRTLAKRADDPVVRSPVITRPALPGGPAAPPPSLPPAPTVPAPGGGNIVFRFDMTNPRAEARIREEAASRVVGYVEEQIEIARKVIADGFQRGEGPQTIATDIAGRVNPVTKRREGGILGLSDPQVGYVASMRRRLLSGDPDEMVKVLGSFDKDGKWKPGTGMTLRDRRFDRSIQKAIREVAAGKPNPLTADKVAEMTAKYADQLLARRAEDIARTETASGVEMARAEMTRQALDKAGLPDTAVTKGWIHQGGVRNARDPHLAMNGRTVEGLDMPFILPDGSVMLYPHDPAGGVKNNANCRCRGELGVDWAYGL